MAAVAQEYGAAVHGRRVLGGPDQRREKRVADVQDHDADGAAVSRAQLPGGVVEDVGDRSHRNLRMVGYVLDAGCPRHSAESSERSCRLGGRGAGLPLQPRVLCIAMMTIQKRGELQRSSLDRWALA